MARITLVTLAISLALVSSAHAQVSPLPQCTGHDAAGASAEFEAGNALLAQAIDAAVHRHPEHVPAFATEALTHFDRQCELGDASAYAERGAALLMLGQALASAQSYDAYLATHPLDSLEARSRRRIEPNLQPGVIDLEIQNARGHLFIDDLDFGALPRTTGIHVPYGDHHVEVRDADGTVLASEQASVSAESAHATVTTFVAPVVTTITPPPDETAAVPDPGPTAPADSSRTDFLPFYIASGITTGVGLILGISFIVAADERARTYNGTCFPTMIDGCSSVLSERDLDIDLAIVGFVVGGIGLAGLITTWILDASQPRARVRVAVSPFGVSGTF